MVRRIEAAIQMQAHRTMRRRGVVVALSGGVDSSVVSAPCTRAFGFEWVFGLLLPEKESGNDREPATERPSMCGIAGLCSLESAKRPDASVLRRMMGMMRHRGPDESGIYLDDRVALGNLRLSIVDLDSGCQPIHNEDETLWIVYNGEVFNYVELRRELQTQGHRFHTTSDTEVILHLFEQWGPQCLEQLNGQFALAIWDSRTNELFLARDRVGIRPLHYAIHDKTVLFASEIKALFAVGGMRRELDPVSLDQIFTFWAVLPGRTPFRDVHELPPGHWMRVSEGNVEIRRYWEIPLYGRQDQLDEPVEQLCDRTLALLTDATRLRLRADVPVGSYLSGGLDSSGIAALVARRFNANLNTFGIRFDQEDFDEGTYQHRVASWLGTNHREVWAGPSQIGAHFADTLWHCERPLLRTAPVPLYLLSAAVRENHLKVVLTGEGADEVFGGYNIFKEAKVRAFSARHPDTRRRTILFDQLYDYVFRDQRTKHFVGPFFARGLDRVDDPLFSHLIRWENTSRTKTFFSNDLRSAVGDHDPYESMRAMLPDRYRELDVVGKAQHLEMMVFLSNYLLSSQGDRVAMAHSVEIRLPFLDYRVIDLAARIPSRWKMFGLDEKHVLKRAFRSLLPGETAARRKHPYRAPIVACLLGDSSRQFTLEMLEPLALRRTGLFDSAKVSRLVQKLQTATNASEVDSMALAGVLSSQIVHWQFVETFDSRAGFEIHPDLIIDRRSGVKAPAAT